jgi:hypothetical protein
MSHTISDGKKNWDKIAIYAEWVINTMRNQTTGYSAFELVYGRAPVQPMDMAIGYDGFNEITDPSEYTSSIKEWLEKARQVALENVNKTHDKEAPRYNAKRQNISFEPNDSVLEKFPVYEKGLATKLLSKFKGPLRILKKLSNVTYQVIPLSGRRQPYIVNVERLEIFNEGLPEDENLDSDEEVEKDREDLNSTSTKNKFNIEDSIQAEITADMPNNAINANQLELKYGFKENSYDDYCTDMNAADDNLGRFSKRVTRKLERYGYDNHLMESSCNFSASPIENNWQIMTDTEQAFAVNS